MKRIQPIVAVVGAVAVLLTFQLVTAETQQRAAGQVAMSLVAQRKSAADARVIAALHDYNQAQTGTRADRDAALAFLMQALKDAEGP